MKKLNVYLNEEFIGELVQDKSGRLAFAYASAWLNAPNAVALSCSLPLRAKTFKEKECRGFFSGLLPEDSKRRLIAGILGISPRNDFAMLEKIGGECAGAVAFLPSNEDIHKTGSEYRPLSSEELAKILQILPKRPLMAGESGVRLSLAGVQDKIAVMIKGGIVHLPLGNAPSTHILKPAIERFEGLVHNESVCMRIAAGLGIPSVKIETMTVEGIEYLLVERFDRVIHSDGSIERLHQEDFCQALGFEPEMKYQSEGGPSLKRCFDLVRSVSSQPALDLKNLLDAVIFNFLVGNCDAHAKNFSLLYRYGDIRLAPLYDIVCTVFYKELSNKMAMKIGGKYEFERILPRHFEFLAKEAGLSVPIVIERVSEVAGLALSAMDNLAVSNESAKAVMKIIRKRCERVAKIFRSSRI